MLVVRESFQHRGVLAPKLPSSPLIEKIQWFALIILTKPVTRRLQDD